MEEATHYKLASYLGHTVYLTVQVKELRLGENQSVVLLGMYVENDSGTTVPSLGSSRLSLGAYNGGAEQSLTFPTALATAGDTTWLAQGLELTVTHAPDGTATDIPLSWLWNIRALGGKPLSGSFALELPSLDLATTPAIYTTNYYSLGETMRLSADPCQTGLTHELSYDILGVTGEIARGVSGGLEWTIPEELLTALTSMHYASVELVCATYRGELCLGTKRRGFYLKPGDVGRMSGQEGWCRFVPESDNEITDAWGVCLAGASRVRAEVDYDKVILAAGADVSKAQLYIDGKPYAGLSSPILRDSNAHTFRVVLTDSRGFGLACTRVITPYPYSPPTLSGAACFRSGIEGNADDAGSFLSLSYTPIFSPVGEHNQAVTELLLYSPAGALLERETLKGSGVYLGSLSAQSSYRAVLVITDSLGNTGSMAFTIPPQTVAFQIREGGDGAAFGGLATESDCLDIQWSRLRVGGEEVADFPVEQGTAGGWTYEKWKSGLARCWGSLSGTAELTTSVGSVYAGDIGAAELPSLFAEAPMVHGTVHTSGLCWLSAGTPGDAAQTPGYRLLSPEAGTISYRLELYCTGRWKE